MINSLKSHIEPNQRYKVKHFENKPIKLFRNVSNQNLCFNINDSDLFIYLFICVTIFQGESFILNPITSNGNREK